MHMADLNLVGGNVPSPWIRTEPAVQDRLAEDSAHSGTAHVHNQSPDIKLRDLDFSATNSIGPPEIFSAKFTL